jgi:hypothetical protein
MADSFVEWQAASMDEKTKEVSLVHRHFGPEPGFRVSVHRIVGREGWFMTCHPMEIHGRALASENIEEAKEEAVGVVEPWVYAVFQDISGII